VTVASRAPGPSGAINSHTSHRTTTRSTRAA